MSTRSVAERNRWSMGYLHIDTSNLGLKPEESCPPEVLLTPISTTSDGRRSSLASINWSFVSQNLSECSHASSTPSPQSIQEPSTPSQHGLPIDYSFVGSDSSLEEIPLQSTHNGAKSAFLESQFMQQSSPPAGGGQFDFQPDADWVYIQKNSDIQNPKLPYYADDGMMPASGDFSSALGASLSNTRQECMDQQGLYNLSFSRLWDCQQPGPSLEDGLRSNSLSSSSELDGNMLYGWHILPSRAVVPSSGVVDISTIVPSDVVRDGGKSEHDYDHHPQSSSQQHLHSLNSCDGCDMEECGAFHVFENESHPSDSEDNWSTAGPMQDSISSRKVIVSKTGAKSIKKERRSSSDQWEKKERRSAVSRRKSRTIKTISYRHRLNNLDVDVQVQQPRNSKKHTCSFILDNGRCCISAFERVEHLRRHELTHWDVRNYNCPVCPKKFGRRDNWHDHLKTHLSITKSGRNPRIEFEKLFEILRRTEGDEEAQKHIDRLIKWREDGGHLKSSSTPARNRT